MIIANPIFDSVFKYLLQNLESAQLLIELVTRQNIETIIPINKDFIKANRKKIHFNDKYLKEVLKENRLDFACTIKNEKGEEKTIIIELQRTNLKTDLVRFRRYIGSHYLQSQAFNSKDQTEPLEPLEIQGIYFLGEGDRYTKDHLATITLPVTFDFDTNQPINKKSPFIQKLTHSIIVINIPALNNPKHQDSELFKILQIFNQENVVMNTKAQFIEIDEAQFPTKFRPLLQRLNADALDPDIALLLESEALVEESRNREIREYQKRQEKSQEQNKKLHESLLNERKAKIEAQRKQEEAQRKQEEAQRKQEEAQRNSIKMALEFGATPETIAEKLNLPLDEVNRIINTL